MLSNLWALSIEIRGLRKYIQEIGHVSVFLRILTLWLALLTTVVALFSKFGKVYNFFLLISMLILWSTFQASNLLSYYFFFEVSILPVLLLILGWGYQPERISSFFYIFFYTLFGSLPLLITLVYVLTSVGTLNLAVQLSHIYIFNSLESIIIFSAFFIKLPLYFTHIWLPKAHVEAPVVGSIILAGLILKLGGMGMLIGSKFSVYPNVTLLAITTLSTVGGALIGVLLIRLTDIKVIIAYSSVVHMRLIRVRIISWTRIGVVGRILMIIAHGFTSPGIFYGANNIYERSHTRSVILNKGLLRFNPSLTLLWFSLTVLNFGGPFTVNLLSEILLINILSATSPPLLVWVAGMCFFSLVYNLILYASINQGIVSSFTLNSKYTIREKIILSRIIAPAFIILFRI